MRKEGRLLVCDDNGGVLTAVELLMRNYFQEVRTIGRPDMLPTTLRQYRPDVLLLDMNFRASINTGNEGLYWLGETMRISPQTRVVLFTAYADVSLAVEGMKRGAADFITKPFENKRLIEVLNNAYRNGSESATGGDGGTTAAAPARMLWGTSAAMLQLKAITEKVARTDANILITGENGTGKELLAREIHRLSKRAAKPMVAVDMGAVTETLFESELFGYVRGAFTDAKSDHAGKMETAAEGTLFMDEIGNLSYQLQAKLLRSLQQRQITRVGGTKPIDIDIRLVCATNRDLKAMADKGDFRDDLLYRINTIQLHLPPLRERRDDIQALATLFAGRFAKAYGKPDVELCPDAVHKLQLCPWDGNIRELEHCVEKAVILSDGGPLRADDFDCQATSAAPKGQDTAPDEGHTLEDMERIMVRQALERCSGNMTLAARQLGVSRQSLYNKLKKYGL